MSKFNIGDKVQWTDTKMNVKRSGTTVKMSSREGKVHGIDGVNVTVIYRKKEIKIHEDNLRHVGEAHSALTELVKSMAGN